MKYSEFEKYISGSRKIFLPVQYDGTSDTGIIYKIFSHKNPYVLTDEEITTILQIGSYYLAHQHFLVLIPRFIKFLVKEKDLSFYEKFIVYFEFNMEKSFLKTLSKKKIIFLLSLFYDIETYFKSHEDFDTIEDSLNIVITKFEKVKTGK